MIVMDSSNVKMNFASISLAIYNSIKTIHQNLNTTKLIVNTTKLVVNQSYRDTIAMPVRPRVQGSI